MIVILTNLFFPVSQVRLKKEQEEKERKRKEKAEAHLYTIIKVLVPRFPCVSQLEYLGIKKCSF